MDSDRHAKKLSDERLGEMRQKKLAKPVQTSLETLFKNIEAGDKKVLKLISRPVIIFLKLKRKMLVLICLTSEGHIVEAILAAMEE